MFLIFGRGQASTPTSLETATGHGIPEIDGVPHHFSPIFLEKNLHHLPAGTLFSSSKREFLPLVGFCVAKKWLFPPSCCSFHAFWMKGLRVSVLFPMACKSFHSILFFMGIPMHGTIPRQFSTQNQPGSLWHVQHALLVNEGQQVTSSDVFWLSLALGLRKEEDSPQSQAQLS